MDQDCVIVGASFAGFACATALARCGARVTLVDRRAEAGEKLHTTGLLVREAVEQVPLLAGVPCELVRPIEGVRLYAPNMRHVDLDAPGYYFLATDTPGLMRWLSARAAQAGVRIRWRTLFTRVARIRSGFDLGPELGTTRYLVAADGPRSSVARVLALGQSTRFLAGIEYEIRAGSLADPGRLHCFIDRRLMPGYIGWLFQGVGLVQVGLARRQQSADLPPLKSAMRLFLEKIATVHDLRVCVPSAVRAGLIPCGGVVRPAAAPGVLLIGDAAGMVSPVTAGGIHMALKHGLSAGHAIAQFLAGRGTDPAGFLEATYPRYRLKRALRLLFDHFQADWVFNLLLATRPMRQAASLVYFHKRSVYEGKRRGGD